MKFYRNPLICLLASLFFLMTNGICNKAKPEKIYSLRKITMSKEWYAEQAELWKMEIDKDLSNPDAWYNYYQACRYAIKLGLPVSSVNSIKRPEEIIKEMGKAVPESFEYHLVKEELLDKSVEKIRALEEAYKMRPRDPRTYFSLISLYERTRQLINMIFLSKSYRQYSDEQLMGLIRKGDASSFDELYKRYSHRLLHYFYRMLNGDEEKAQDFLQDICLKIVEKADTFNPEGKFSSWIFTIASNMCKNEYRRMRKRISMDNETIDRYHVGPEKAIEEEIDHKNFCDYLYKELYELGYDKRSVFERES